MTSLTLFSSNGSPATILVALLLSYRIENCFIFCTNRSRSLIEKAISCSMYSSKSFLLEIFSGVLKKGYYERHLSLRHFCWKRCKLCVWNDNKRTPSLAFSLEFSKDFDKCYSSKLFWATTSALAEIMLFYFFIFSLFFLQRSLTSQICILFDKFARFDNLANLKILKVWQIWQFDKLTNWTNLAIWQICQICLLKFQDQCLLSHNKNLTKYVVWFFERSSHLVYHQLKNYIIEIISWYLMLNYDGSQA